MNAATNKDQGANNFAIADSGTTGHYLRVSSPVVGKVQVNEGVRVLLPDGNTITSSHEAYLDMPTLPKAARKAHIFPGLAHDALISIAQLCDEDYIAIFDKENIHIIKDGTIAIQGTRHPRTKLYMINLVGTNKPGPIPEEIRNAMHTSRPNTHSNNVYELKNSKDIVQYY